MWVWSQHTVTLPPVQDALIEEHQIHTEHTKVQEGTGHQPRGYVIANTQSGTALEMVTQETPHLQNKQSNQSNQTMISAANGHRANRP